MVARNYPLRIPESILRDARLATAQDGVSLNQFIGAAALAEKVSALRTQAVLEERARRADGAAFDAVIARAGGMSPREGDEIVEE